MTAKTKTAGETAVQVYTWNELNVEVRGIIIDGNPWLVAKDLCDYLELGNITMALERLDDDEKLTRKLFVSGQERSMWLVNESGTYALILRSNKPKARGFRKWITNEVLPSIRKTGRYEAATVSQRTEQGVAVRRGPRRATAAELMTVELMNLLWLIDESLFLGDRKAVAMDLGVSRVTVNNVLRGRVRNARVLMALYQKAKENRACGLLYQRPELMSSRLTADESVDDETFMRRALPAVIYGNRKKGGQIGNQNARKHWRKEGK